MRSLKVFEQLLRSSVEAGKITEHQARVEFEKRRAWQEADIQQSASQPQPPATMLKKAANFAASAAKHVAAGMPMASEEEVARRFAICEGCEHFDGRACRQCGCPVVRERQYLSKLSWADSSCPVGKWGPVPG